MTHDILAIVRPAEMETLTQFLQAEGFRVEKATDEVTGIERALSGNFALVILEASPVRENGICGTESLRRIRQRSLLPALVLTTEFNEAERSLALELGADDYLGAPYSPSELAARANALLGRSGVNTFRHFLRAGELELDVLNRTVNKGVRKIDLTTAEFDLLELLLKRAGQAVSREEIAQSILGRPLNYNDRSIDMHVSNIRRKLRVARNGAGSIRSVRGIGYSFATL
jgi:DNA-binding response OmpR family regulator